MEDPLEICSLSATELEERRRHVRTRLLPAVVAREPLENGLAFELQATDGLREQVDLLIALESQCCGAIEWARAPSRHPDRIRLEIRNVDPRSPVFDGWLGGDAATPGA